MRYTWDSKKAEQNAKSHDGVTFGEAALAIEMDPHAIREVDLDQNELRLRVLCWSTVGRVLFVVTVEIEDDETRIVSARKAEPNEEAHYYAEIQGNDELRDRSLRRRKRSRGRRKRP